MCNDANAGCVAGVILAAVILIAKQLLSGVAHNGDTEYQWWERLYLLGFGVGFLYSNPIIDQQGRTSSVHSINSIFCIFTKFSTGSLYSDSPRRQCDLFSMEGGLASRPWGGVSRDAGDIYPFSPSTPLGDRLDNVQLCILSLPFTHSLSEEMKNWGWIPIVIISFFTCYFEEDYLAELAGSVLLPSLLWGANWG